MSNPIGRVGAGQALRLADPSAAAAFTERAATTLQTADLSFETWQVQRDYALGDAQPTQVIATMFTILLLIVAFVVVGILVGARATDQHREIGLLKAAGFTPRQVGAVFALESTTLGLVAAALGFAPRVDHAPRLAAPSAEALLGSLTVAANPWHILVASCVVLPVLLAGALTSTRRSTRFSVLEAIRAGSPSPPNSRLARAVARSVLPLTIGLGLRDLLARGRRTLLLAAAIALTGAVVVVALSVDATVDAQAATGQTSDIPDELPLLIYTLDTVLLLITLTTLVAVALLSVRERIRDYGVLKAIGLTPRQITFTVISAHGALALVASLLAVPLGVGLYLALALITSGTAEDAVVAPWPSLALIPIGAVLVVVAATSARPAGHPDPHLRRASLRVSGLVAPGPIVRSVTQSIPVDGGHVSSAECGAPTGVATRGGCTPAGTQAGRDRSEPPRKVADCGGNVASAVCKRAVVRPPWEPSMSTS